MIRPLREHFQHYHDKEELERCRPCNATQYNATMRKPHGIGEVKLSMASDSWKISSEKFSLLCATGAAYKVIVIRWCCVFCLMLIR